MLHFPVSKPELVDETLIPSTFPTFAVTLEAKVAAPIL
jgi:hypothetical protein